MSDRATKPSKKPLDKPEAGLGLKEFANIFKEFNLEDLETVDIAMLQDLHNEYAEIIDPRVPERVHFQLADVILIILLGVLSNCNEFHELEMFATYRYDWLKQFLKLEYGVPSGSTMQRVLSMIDVKLLYNITLNYFLKFAQMATAKVKSIKAALAEESRTTMEENMVESWIDAAQNGVQEPFIDIIACDGKVSRDSRRKATDRSPDHNILNTLSAYSVRLCCCLRQEFIEKKTNEITSMPSLLKGLEIQAAVITCDALNTQPEIAEIIIERSADYVMPVKGNRKTLHGDFQILFSEKNIEKIRNNSQNSEQYLHVEGREQGKKVIREYFLIDPPSGLYKAEEWPGLKRIGLVRRTAIEKAPKTGASIIKYEDRYYLSSITKIISFAQSVRGHWGVENSLHWQLDYTFKDDQNKTTIGRGAEGLQLIKKLSLMILNILRAVSPPHTSLKELRFAMSLAFEQRAAVLLNLFSASVIDKICGIIAK